MALNGSNAMGNSGLWRCRIVFAGSDGMKGSGVCFWRDATASSINNHEKAVLS